MKTTYETRQWIRRAAAKLSAIRELRPCFGDEFAPKERDEISLAFDEAMYPLVNKRETELYTAAKKFVEEYEEATGDENPAA